MKASIGLSSEQREGVISTLNTLLSDEYILYTKTRNYHWNVVGPQFNDLHKFFETQYNELNLVVDEVAERARALGGQALGTVTEFSQLARLKEHPGRYPGARDMVVNLLSDHEAIIITRYTKAQIFAAVGKQTPCFLRFSTVAGERGAADAERDVRGFAVKFYTDDGNWDLVGNNTPVFFVRDPYKFPDFIRTQKRDPKTNLRNPTAMWDFWSLSPESLHQVTILFSDRGLPALYRHVNGYGSHTFSLLNEQNERFWVKFHFKTLQGIQCWTDEEAAKVIGEDRESHQRDLFQAIKRGDFPKWRLMVQVMPEADADNTPYNPFDLTKVWPHKDYPLIEVGILELNRNPENYFAEVEQAGFSPANVVPGIGHSPDKMLQFRIISYADAHRYRLGVNYDSLPVNRPQVPVHSYHRDGAMRFDDNAGGTVNYEPNSFNGPQEDARYKEPPLKISGDADRYDHREGNDDYTQAGNLFRLMTSEE